MTRIRSETSDSVAECASVRDFVRRGFLLVERARCVLTRKAAETLNFQDRCHNFACFARIQILGFANRRSTGRNW